MEKSKLLISIKKRMKHSWSLSIWFALVEMKHSSIKTVRGKMEENKLETVRKDYKEFNDFKGRICRGNGILRFL